MRPKLTVSVITYNQERYVAELLDSILSQQCDFGWEILISDDASTDSTPSILADFASKFPDLVRLRLRTTRVGMKTNFLENLTASKGEFIALCDGDDLWTNSSKLQRQVKLLEENRDLSMCFHYTNLVTKNGHFKSLLPIPEGRKPRSSAEELIVLESFMPTSSVVLRNNQPQVFPDWFWLLENQVDYPLFLHYANFGDIGFIPINMGTYRTGSSSDSFTSRSAAAIYIEQSRMFSLLTTHGHNPDQPSFLFYQDRDLRRAAKILSDPRGLPAFLKSLMHEGEPERLKRTITLLVMGLLLCSYATFPSRRFPRARRHLATTIYGLAFPPEKYQKSFN